MSLNLDGLDDLNLDDVGSATAGVPLLVPFSDVYEDPNNPRKEFDEGELRELADDIAQHGILQAIVVWPKDSRGYKIRYGAKRRRAAEIAAAKTGIKTVPVFVNDNAELDDYAQVAENLKRSGLTALDMARFIQTKIGAGQTKAVIASRLGLQPGRISEYIALLDLPYSLKAVYDTGRCTSPQVLYLLGALRKRHPDAVDAWLLHTEGDITRTIVSALEQSILAEAKERAEMTSSLPTEEGAGLGGSGRGASNKEFGALKTLPTEEGKVKGGKASKRPDPNIISLERRLTDNLGARSRVQYNSNTGFGSVSIRFTSLEELDGLLAKFGIPKE